MLFSFNDIHLEVRPVIFLTAFFHKKTGRSPFGIKELIFALMRPRVPFWFFSTIPGSLASYDDRNGKSGVVVKVNNCAMLKAMIAMARNDFVYWMDLKTGQTPMNTTIVMALIEFYVEPTLQVLLLGIPGRDCATFLMR